MRVSRIATIIIMMILMSSLCQARSLWLNGNDLYSAKGSRDFRPGDIITIVISEKSNAQSRATTNTQKESTVEANSGPSIPVLKGVMNQIVGKAETSTEFDGQGSTTRSGNLTGTVTATVIEVLDNGNVLIEGSRSIRVNNETQLMRVRGIARSRDIDINNSISSQLLADAQIKFDGQGAIGRTNRPGFITRVFNTIF